MSFDSLKLSSSLSKSLIRRPFEESVKLLSAGVDVPSSVSSAIGLPASDVLSFVFYSVF